MHSERSGHLGTSISKGVLLSSASASGTLAAARCLGSSGYDVSILFHSRLSAAVWSRHVKNAHPTAHENEPERFFEQLKRIGADRPGRILLPTSDQTAWQYSMHAEELRRDFCLYQPPVETIRRILDKSLLAEAAKRVSIAVPRTWDSAHLQDFGGAAALPYPLLIKPRAHVHRINNDKGVIVHSQQKLLTHLARFNEREKQRSVRADSWSAPAAPLLQKFIAGGGRAISVTGFVDRSGELFVTRRSVKTFQRMSATGVGVCFESLPEDRRLSDAVRALCCELGYFGLFEVEFIRDDGSWALIDFNPRLFNHVALDIRRAMPLPLFACLDATNERAPLRKAVREAQQYDQSAPAVILDSFTLRAILLAKRFAGRGAATERQTWRDWLRQHRDHAVDLAFDREDTVPGLVHAISETCLGLRAIPRFLGSNGRSSASLRFAEGLS